MVQALLALEFSFAGGMKLVPPVTELTKQTPLPGLFLRFIGTCEVLGAMELILAGLVRIRQGLTPLAATGLAIVMIGDVGCYRVDDGSGTGCDPSGYTSLVAMAVRGSRAAK
jgi:hypothetical protein